MSEAASARRAAEAGKARSFLMRSTNLYIFFVLVALIAFFSLISPNHAFFVLGNFINIVWDRAETLLLAIGETFVIITAGIDLSVGTVLMVSGVVASWVIAQTGGPAAQVVNGNFPNAAARRSRWESWWASASACSAGAVNGVLVTRLRMPAFIVTLGVFSIANGLGDLVSSGGAAGPIAIPPIPASFAATLGNSNLLLGLPTLVVVAALAAFITHIVLTQTSLAGAPSRWAAISRFASGRRAGEHARRPGVYVRAGSWRAWPASLTSRVFIRPIFRPQPR